MAEVRAWFSRCDHGEGQRALTLALDHVLGLLMRSDPSRKGADDAVGRVGLCYLLFGQSLISNLVVDVLIPQRYPVLG